MPLTSEERNDALLHFLLLDQNSDDKIETSQLGTYLRSVGLYPTDTEVNSIIKMLDSNNTGEIGKEDALDTVRLLSENQITEQDLREALRVLDDDEDGFLTTAQLRHILVNMGTRLSDAEADEVIADADAQMNSQINVEYLTTLLMKGNKLGRKD